MKHTKLTAALLIGMIFTMSCDSEIEEGVMKSDLKKDVEMVTSKGTLVLRLSDETPLHRNNFIKLVNTKFYDSISFHRIIENFMVQAGDPETKNSETDKTPGATDLPYTIPAELSPNLFHKKGALGAARTGDDTNPLRASSSTQFYIVQGRVYNDSVLNYQLGRANKWTAYNNVINKPENKAKHKELQDLMGNWQESDSVAKAQYPVLKGVFDSLAEIELENMTLYAYPEDHETAYKTIGGAAHLDQNYTVFGKVVHGLNVIDSIAMVKTDSTDKPLKDVKILSTRMVKRKDY